MKTKLIVILLTVVSNCLAQQTDEIRFYSKAFGTERTVYVTTPATYKYQSDEVKLPVIIILDGQHEWFANPVLSAIKYLQYTHQIPQAIVVQVPLQDRIKECAIQNIDIELPLHKFITGELHHKLQKYNPGSFNVLVGHSFSASFALYSYLKSPTYYSGIIANTPLDSFKPLIAALDKNKEIDKSKISVSVGGRAGHQDFHHRKVFDAYKSEFPAFFNTIKTFVAEDSGHNAVPVVASPFLLSKLFSEFSGRYANIAEVNGEYRLIMPPISVNEELAKIRASSQIGGVFYPPEIAELNGLASRYLNSDLNEYGIAVYELAIRYYPYYYDFHIQMYELLLATDAERSKVHLNKAAELLTTIDKDFPEKQQEIERINEERAKNGW